MDIIARVPLFNGLSTDLLEKVKGIAVEREFKKGEFIFFEGDPGNGFYIVIEGRIKIGKLSPEGKEQIFHILGKGEPFGEVPVFSGESFPANAEALIDSRVYFFPKQSFVNLITQMPSLSLNMLAVLCKRLRQFTIQVENLTLKEVSGRIAGYLIGVSQEQKQSPLMLSISKAQLAGLLGTIPETLSRGFLKLTKLGLIEVSGPKIRIIDAESLKQFAEQGKMTDEI